MKTLLLLVILFAFKGYAFDHQLSSPKVNGLHKGQVVTADELGAHFEVVAQNKKVKIYIHDFAMKPQAVDSFTVTAKTQIGTKQSQIELPLKVHKNYFEAEFAPKGVKKYDLYLSVKNNKNSKEDLLKYTIKTRH